MTNLVKLSLTYEQLAREKIVDNYAWHKKAWELFEHHPQLQQRKTKQENEKGPTPFLSRYTPKSQHGELLLVSKYEPNKPDWCTEEYWRVLTISDEYLAQLTYRFDLYANPTRTVKKPDGQGGFTKNGKRLTLMDKDSQIEWLIRKAENHGFLLRDDIPLQIDKPVDHRFNKNGKKGLHIGVRFQGALQVIDQEKFKKAFNEGIGTSKGFGFGLLLIKPVQI
jgi:CRISPR system Cascade subunit CasE